MGMTEMKGIKSPNPSPIVIYSTHFNGFYYIFFYSFIYTFILSLTYIFLFINQVLVFYHSTFDNIHKFSFPVYCNFDIFYLINNCSIIIHEYFCCSYIYFFYRYIQLNVHNSIMFLVKFLSFFRILFF